MITGKGRQKNPLTSLGSMVSVFLSVLLVLSLVFPSSSKSQGTETTPNYLPSMQQHLRSGSTLVNQGTSTTKGCKSGNYCTGGKQGPGGTYTSTFDLEDNMTIDEINSGFTMDYGMDVDSHQSNLVRPSCVNGNVMQNNDCKDIFRLTVSLFDTDSVLAHQFEHEVELDWSGVRNFSFSQTIPENSYTSLTGEYEMYGIDAGFGNKFFGPAFSNPSLTITFDLVTIIETEVIDLLNNTSVLDQNTPEDVEVAGIEVEVETQDGQQMTTLELEVNTEMSMEMELELPSIEVQQAPEVEVEVAEVSAEIETEISNGSEMANDESTESTTESGGEQSNEPEPETQPESEPEPESEPDSDGPEESSGGESETEPEPESEVRTSGGDTEEQDKPSSVKPKTKVTKKTSAKQKAARKIVKKMGDKGRYDSTNQLKTLVIMGVLGNTKQFLVQPTIPQPTGFFTDKKMPDAQLPENNTAAWMLMGGSNQLHNKLTGLQYKEK